MAPPTRQRAMKLRSGNVPMTGTKGRTTPLSKSDKARAFVNYLTQSVPPNRFILIPRTWKEAHHRPDSLCAVLGIPFAELGPLLFAAGILVKNNLRQQLSFSLDGFQALGALYNPGPSSQIEVEHKRPPPNEWNADPLTDTDHPPIFWYIIRGSRNRQSPFQYIPLVTGDAVGSTLSNAARRDNARALGQTILADCDSEIAKLFVEPTQPELRQALIGTSVSDETSRHADDPSLIRIDQGTEHPSTCFTLATQAVSELMQESVGELCGSTAGDSSKSLPGAPEQVVPFFPATIAEELDLSRRLDFDSRINNQRPPRHPVVGTPINVTARKQATEAMRVMTVWLAARWGYRQAPTKKEKLEIAEMASRVVFYDCGCPKPPKGSMVAAWITELDNARFNNGTDFAEALTNEQLGPRQGTSRTLIRARRSEDDADDSDAEE